MNYTEGKKVQVSEVEENSSAGSARNYEKRVRLDELPSAVAELLSVTPDSPLRDGKQVLIGREEGWDVISGWARESARQTPGGQARLWKLRAPNTPGQIVGGHWFEWTQVRDLALQNHWFDEWPLPSTPNGHPGTASPSFGALLDSLAQQSLYFTPEVVSNFLLALQTKRFVILTGLSGTGKTLLPMAVARHCQPLVDAPPASGANNGALEVTVRAYMRNNHILVLPSRILPQLRLPSPQTGTRHGPITVIWPEDQDKLQFYLRPNRPVTTLLIKDKFRKWFDRTFEVGNSCFLSVEGTGDGDGPQALRFSLPAPSRAKERLDNFRVVAVRPDWTDNRGLLGYYNPLSDEYVVPPFLGLLLRAGEECERAKRDNRAPYPFFAILDEMNLARVEHYFSDLLSSLESGEPLDLHQNAEVESGEDDSGVMVPRRLAIPPNVFFIGTVNIDETTSMFSPKVLDRAFTIEFDRVDLQAFGQLAASPAVPADSPLFLHRLPETLVYRKKPDVSDWNAFGQLSNGEFRQAIVLLNGLLAPVNRHFGYRVANEIARFVNLAAGQADPSSKTLWAALDLVILEKVLPKFHGTQQELEAPLLSLFAFAISATSPSPAGAPGLRPEDWEVVEGRVVQRAAPDVDPKFPRTALKVWRMLRRLQSQGFTAFIE